MQQSKLLPAIFFFLAITMFFSFQSRQENNSTSDLPFSQLGTNQWYKMNADTRIPVSDFLEEQKAHLGLSETDEWVNYRSETDELGMIHYRYELHHQGVLVEGSELLVHTQNGFVTHFNGCWVEGLEANINASLSAEEALVKGLEYVPSPKYLWEDAGAEALLQQVNRDPSATFYPAPQLVLYNNNFPKPGGTFQAAYKMIIQAYYPQTRKLIYVDANNGVLLHQIELLHHSTTPAVAETKYYETQMIFSDSVATDSFRLYETTRGFGVHTMDLNKSEEAGDAVEFWDTDNYWDTVNDEQDEAALDAHWSAEITYDFFHQHLGHTGIDGDSMQLLSLVHYGVNVVNAFWNGFWCTLGDGNGVGTTALTSLDVMGHEFAHGVTRNTGNLIYQNESGALNESFSDIFGTAIEFWAEGDSADYIIGEDFHVNGSGFRLMSDPKYYGHPDTYLGDNWVSDGSDNGGVHSNSGVQNYWFYLLTEGGTGTNDNGFDYEVEALGMDTSTIIAFRNLKYYLTRFSQYEDARLGSLISAEDLYGPCSFAAQQTVKAWRAVGVGENSDDNDFEMIRLVIDSLHCGLTDSEFPTIQMRYNGCTTPLIANDKIPLEIQVDNGPIFRDTIVLTTGLVGGDTLLYTFDTPVGGLETMGLHTLKAWVTLDTDQASSNNFTSMVIENVLDQNSDFSNTLVTKPNSDCFMSFVPVQMEVTFLGCDSLVAGSEIFFSFARDGEVLTESTILNNTLYRDETFLYSFSTALNMNNILGNHEIESWVAYPSDFVSLNDSLTISIQNPKHMKYGHILTYEGGDVSIDSFYLQTTAYSNAYYSGLAGFESDRGVVLTGGNGPKAFKDSLVVMPTNVDSVWDVNEILSAKMCVCVNATQLTTVELDFDLRQVYAIFSQGSMVYNLPQLSSLRVLVNDEQVSPTYNPEFQIDSWNHHKLDISDFAGSLLEICFETRNFTSPDFSNIGDRAFLDNVEISGLVGSEDIDNNDFSFTVSPNPGTGNFLIHYQADKSEALQMALYDIHGRKLWTKDYGVRSDLTRVPLDLSNYSDGVYYLRLDNGKTIVTRPVVLMR